ncbi:MAG: M23 family metallopeptidase [Aggregatilineales bacterium]
MQKLIEMLLSLFRSLSGGNPNTFNETHIDCQLGEVEIPSDKPEPDVPFIGSDLVFSSQTVGDASDVTPTTSCIATIRPELGMVNIRTGPRLEFTPAIQTEGGVSFDLVGASERDEDGLRWFQVSIGAGSGWIRSDLVTISRDCLHLSYITEEDIVPAVVVTPPATDRFPIPADVTISQGYNGAHRAYDLATPMNTPIRAATDGTLIRVVECTACTESQPNFRGSPDCQSIYNKLEWGYGYGNFIVIRHDYALMPPTLRTQMDRLSLTGGFVYVLYAHFSTLNVRFGQQVIQGHVLGLTGNHGCSTGPHLHFEVRAGKREMIDGVWQDQRPLNPDLMFVMR